MYCVYGNSGWYILNGPLFGGGLLLGEHQERNVRDVVSRQLIELLDDVGRLLFDRQRHPRNTRTTISKCVLYYLVPRIVVCKRVLGSETSRVRVRLCPRFFSVFESAAMCLHLIWPGHPLLYPHAQSGIP